MTGARPLPFLATATTSNHPAVFESFPWGLERIPGHLPAFWLPGLLTCDGRKEQKRSEKDVALSSSSD